ncbi:MAG TPA: CsbD family protein [Acidobacteriaceae bacterium]|nr:CsbD family protein [Acidobacteriaceae bacterium]
MKALTWLIAGVGIGVAAYIVLNQPGPQYATGNDDVEDAADRTALWGSKQRASGAGRGIVGKVKEGLGNVTENDQLAAEGVADQAVGGVKDAAGKVAQAVGQTIHELNR